MSTADFDETQGEAGEGFERLDEAQEEAEPLEGQSKADTESDETAL